MEPVYVVAIAAGGVFIILLLIYFYLASKRKKKRAALKNHLDRAYAPKNLKKMDYDLAYYDEAAMRILDSKIAEEQQVTIDDILAPFGKSEASSSTNDLNEDEEELVGKYNPN